MSHTKHSAPNSAMKRTVAAILMAAMGASALSGCMTTASRHVREDYKTTSELAVDKANQGARTVQSSSVFIRDNGFYVDKTPIAVTPVDPAQQLPSMFMKTATMNIQTPTTLTEVAARVSKLVGSPVSIAPDVLDGSGGLGQVVGNPGSSAGSSAAASGSGSSPSVAPPAIPVPTGLSSGNTNDKTPPPVMVSDVYYKDGNLAGLLDTITGKLNLSWRWTGQRVEIYRYETRVYHLNALAGVAKMSAELNTTASTTSTSSGGSSTQSSSNQTGTSGQNTSINSTSSIWEEVGSTLQSMLSAKGTMSMAPSAGIITVKDTPTVLRQIEAQVRELNKIYSKQVLLNVEVYSVENQDGDNYSINWNSLLSSAAGKWGLAYSAVTGTNTSTSANGTNTFTVTSPGGGTKAIVNALSTVGKTSLVTSGTVISLNGQTVPLNVSREEAYLQSYATTLAGTSGNPTTTLTPGVVTEGFSMNFTPRITEGNNIMMRYTVDLSSIDSITTFTAPDNTSVIQLPQRSVRNFMQNVNVKSGQTLVLTGFQQVQAQDSSSGLGNAQAWVLGGAKAATALNRTIVILVTPYITN